MVLKVLLADDQIPWGEDYKDEKVREEIVSQLGEVLKAKGKDPDTCYFEDKKWFENLLKYLDPKFELTLAREYELAEIFVSETKNYDVAVIDLSWAGDPTRKGKPRDNIGLKLLDKLSETGLPTIAFSQNFEKDRELMSDVLEHGALPLQKHYDDSGYQALASAIKYVANASSLKTEKLKRNPEDITIQEIFHSLSELKSPQAWKVIGVITVVFSCLIAGVYNLGANQVFSKQTQETGKSIQQSN